MCNNAEAIYKKIIEYDGKQFTEKNPWHPVEQKLFDLFANWFNLWMRNNGKSDPFTVTNEIFEFCKHKEKNSQNKTIELSMISGYNIRDLKSLIGAIHDIGRSENTQNRIYVFNFKKNNVAATSYGSHYSYAVEINGEQVQNSQNDKDEFGEPYKELLKNDGVVAFFNYQNIASILRTGEINWKNEEIQKNKRFILEAFVANYICESNRNWMNLLLCLLQLGLAKVTTVECYNGKKNDGKKTEIDYEFVMAGGSWTHKYSWGGGNNKNKETGATSKTGQLIKRLFLKEIIRILNQFGGGDDKKKNQVWLTFIEKLCASNGAYYGQEIINLVETQLEKAVMKINTL